jgi:hypothetical protein
MVAITMRRTNSMNRTLALGGALVAAATLIGCSTSGSYSKAKDYQLNPSPELDTLHERDIDITNRMSITMDENLRMFNEDLGRVFLLDRQSRLSPAPITR